MIDLEHGEIRQGADPIGSRVESRAENDELLDPLSECSSNRVVDQSRPRDGG